MGALDATFILHFEHPMLKREKSCPAIHTSEINGKIREDTNLPLKKLVE